jgi:pimeloyl-ACP methyl ester carboxylesterase
MPKVKANGLTMNYDQQGAGEPLVLIPYIAADHACYAFRSPSTPTTSPASHRTCVEPAGRTSRNAVLAHDLESQLGRIKAPTQITFGERDALTSTRFADRLKNGIKGGR